MIPVKPAFGGRSATAWMLIAAALLLLRRQWKKNKPWEVQDGQNLLLPLLSMGRGAERAL